MPTVRTTLSTSFYANRQRKYAYIHQFFSRLLVYFSPKYSLKLIKKFALLIIEALASLLRFIPESIYPNLLYPIEDEIVSTTTRVILTRRKQNQQQVCLKLWQQKVCNQELVMRHAAYLVEGFEFNRRFAPKVYLGIAPVKLSMDTTKIRRGKLIDKPKKRDLKPEVDYVVVMRCLDRDWRLDYQLSQGGLGTQKGIEFLAREVARMHRQLEKSPEAMGEPERISSKLAINSRLYQEALHLLASDPDHTGKHDLLRKYGWLSNLMVQACESYTGYFEQRCEDGSIKRCHGDLKTSNLWVRPKRSLFGLKKSGQELIALDCIDFNPEFCHIDILSDVAMLAIDIETHLIKEPDKGTNKHYVQQLARHFLDSYLREVEETSEAAWPLLEYYMTEKAMVCAYVSILYDDQLTLGKKYLTVALSHAQRLEKMLKHENYQP